MAKVLCVLYDDPTSGYPPRYARNDIPKIERYPDGQTVPNPRHIDFVPGELLGCVSGELGLRSYLEDLGHTFIVTSDKDGPDSETAVAKVRAGEDGWNTRDPEKVCLAYTIDSHWRNRAEFVTGREEIKQFHTRKWRRELDYRLIKELWAFDGSRIAVRFAYECHDDSGNWFRSYGNENWEFDQSGIMHHRYACINDLPIKESERKYHWPLGRRPDDHLGLTELGL